MISLWMMLRRRPTTALVAAGLGLLAATRAAALRQPVELTTKSGTLAGTLDLPSGTGPFSVVVIVAGAGPTDRDGNQPSMKNDSLKLLGEGLAARGIAALRYDKRGTGESAAAVLREQDLRFETFAGDVVDWIGLLRGDPRFHGVGLIGHSEGSLLGMLAAQQAKLDAFVSIAGAARPAPAIIREQLRAKLSAAQTERGIKILDELVAGRTVADTPSDLAALFRPSVQPYLISWFKYDPSREMARLHVPMLIVQGTTDLQVSVEDAKRLVAANKDAKLVLIDGMNHVLKRATIPAEQQTAYTDPSLPLAGDLVDQIAAFLSEQMGVARRE